MTKQEALKTITLDTQEVKEELTNRITDLNERFYNENARLDVREFESVIIDIIRYKWMKSYPETFLTCHVTGEEYDKTPKSAYPYKHEHLLLQAISYSTQRFSPSLHQDSNEVTNQRLLLILNNQV